MKSIKLLSITLIIIIDLCATAIANEDNPTLTDEMRKILIDKWCGIRTDNDGSIQKWTVQRFPNGTYKVLFISQDSTGKKKEWGESGVWGIRYPIYFTITTGFIEGTAEFPIDTNDSDLYDAYQILNLSDKEFTYKSYRSDKVFTVTKNCNQ